METREVDRECCRAAEYRLPRQLQTLCKAVVACKALARRTLTMISVLDVRYQTEVSVAVIAARRFALFRLIPAAVLSSFRILHLRSIASQSCADSESKLLVTQNATRIAPEESLRRDGLNTSVSMILCTRLAVPAGACVKNVSLSPTCLERHATIKSSSNLLIRSLMCCYGTPLALFISDTAGQRSDAWLLTLTWREQSIVQSTQSSGYCDPDQS